MPKTHPYKHLPDKAFWRRAVASPTPRTVDPVGVFDLRIDRDTKVATAGSCFAQHIARHLQNSGFNYYVAEPGHPILPAALRSAHGYGLFSARYGNIYTARQLWQLFQRAYGAFCPREAAWIDDDGSVRDPLRPTIQPHGFISVVEMENDRRQHLAAVRTMLESLDVFVFTLGLTECWASVEDGTVFPICPGVEGGEFDADQYVFLNQGLAEVTADLGAFIDGLRSVNDRAQIVLTVSPVPLVATADSGAHVLAATTYSKSVLRVAAEEMRRHYPFVHYFPSYEIISGSFNRGRYFARDLRSVTEPGVEHVMRLFFAHAAAGVAVDANRSTDSVSDRQNDFIHRAESLVQVQCDEVALDRP